MRGTPPRAAGSDIRRDNVVKDEEPQQLSDEELRTGRPRQDDIDALALFLDSLDPSNASSSSCWYLLNLNFPRLISQAGEAPPARGCRRSGCTPPRRGRRVHHLRGRVVLVRMLLPVRRRVEVDQHRRIAEISCTNGPNFPRACRRRRSFCSNISRASAGLVARSGEVAVPEQGHLFQQDVGRVPHPVQPPRLEPPWRSRRRAADSPG